MTQEVYDDSDLEVHLAFFLRDDRETLDEFFFSCIFTIVSICIFIDGRGEGPKKVTPISQFLSSASSGSFEHEGTAGVPVLIF